MKKKILIIFLVVLCVILLGCIIALLNSSKAPAETAAKETSEDNLLEEPSPASKSTLNPTPTIKSEPTLAAPRLLIREYAEKEWGSKTDMVEWEYNQQVAAYEYVNLLPDSDIKNYALQEWQDGEYTIWTMVKWEYDQQLSAYNYMQTVEWDGKQDAIKLWTKDEYTIWTMVKWEYEKK